MGDSGRKNVSNEGKKKTLIRSSSPLNLFSQQESPGMSF